MFQKRGSFLFLLSLENKSKQYPALTCMVAILFIQEQPMSGRKNSQLRRNYLVKCSCPNCAKESEHSFTRIQKGPNLSVPTVALCLNPLSVSEEILIQEVEETMFFAAA